MVLPGTTTTTRKYRTDKTVAEIQTAYNAGKKIVIHFQTSGEVDSKIITIKYVGQAIYETNKESNKLVLTFPNSPKFYENESGYFEFENR